MAGGGAVVVGQRAAGWVVFVCVSAAQGEEETTNPKWVYYSYMYTPTYTRTSNKPRLPLRTKTKNLLITFTKSTRDSLSTKIITLESLKHIPFFLK